MPITPIAFYFKNDIPAKTIPMGLPALPKYNVSQLTDDQRLNGVGYVLMSTKLS
jgi:hypothetical protein